MRRTCVPCKVTRSTKLRGAQRSPELGLRCMGFRAPENLIFRPCKRELFWDWKNDFHLTSKGLFVLEKIRYMI